MRRTRAGSALTFPASPLELSGRCASRPRSVASFVACATEGWKKRSDVCGPMMYVAGG